MNMGVGLHPVRGVEQDDVLESASRGARVLVPGSMGSPLITDKLRAAHGPRSAAAPHDSADPAGHQPSSSLLPQTVHSSPSRPQASTTSQTRRLVSASPPAAAADDSRPQASTSTRAERFEQMLAQWQAIWAGESLDRRRHRTAAPARATDADVRRQRDVTFARAARYGDGWLMGLAARPTSSARAQPSCAPRGRPPGARVAANNGAACCRALGRARRAGESSSGDSSPSWRISWHDLAGGAPNPPRSTVRIR